MVSRSRLTSFMRVMLPVMLAGLTATCFGQNRTASDWNAALNSPTFVKLGSIKKNAPQSILLIGENHASVKTQQQLASLLQALHEEFNAILVEGSSGVVDAQGIRQAVRAKNPTITNTNEFWKGQLDLGHIAGYEFVALTSNSLSVYGVEGRDAEFEYAVGSARRSTLTNLVDLIEKHRRGLALAKQVSATIGEKALQSAGADAELLNYESKIDAFAELTDTNGKKYAQQAETEATFELLRQKMSPILNLLAKGRVQQSDAAIENLFKTIGYSGQADVMRDLNQLKEAGAWLKTNEQEIKRLDEEFSSQASNLEDQFFLLVNTIRSAQGGIATPALQTFLRDESERVRIQTEKQNPEIPFLTNRDQSMLSNTMKYLENNPDKKKIVLIVGYAHLENLTNLFKKQNVSLLTGRIAAATEETEPWEFKAWRARSRPAERIFSGGMHKEKSRLHDSVFRDEIPLVVQRVEDAGINGIRAEGARVLEVRTENGGKKAIVVTPDDSGFRSNWGSYVVASGKLPDNSGRNFQIFDRTRELQAAKQATSESVWFAAAYRTRDANGKTTTSINLPTGAMTIDTFKARVPEKEGNVPARIVLAPEGDGKPIHTALQSEATGGNGAPPYWTTPTGRFAEPPESRRPFLFMTKNISRAREHMNAIETQDPLRAGEITLVKLGLSDQQNSNLDQDLWFSLPRGDHSRAFLIAGENTDEFRRQVKSAAEAGLLKNKQIALATCFDAKETDALREMLLESGALVVWTPESRISPAAAKKLADYSLKVDADSSSNPPKAFDEHMNRAIKLWYRDSPKDPDLAPLMNASWWTDIRIYPSVPAPSLERLSQGTEPIENGF